MTIVVGWDALDEQLTTRGIQHEMRQATSGRSPTLEILAVAEEA